MLTVLKHFIGLHQIHLILNLILFTKTLVISSINMLHPLNKHPNFQRMIAAIVITVETMNHLRLSYGLGTLERPFMILLHNMQKELKLPQNASSKLQQPLTSMNYKESCTKMRVILKKQCPLLMKGDYWTNKIGISTIKP